MSDLIDRQDAIDAFDCTNELIVGGEANARNVVNYINKVVDKIKDLPSAEPERKTGRWVHSPDHSEGVCTSCGFKIFGRPYDGIYLITPHNYCPNCGAFMRGEQE